MARALRAWAINRGGKSSVRNLRYGPRTRLVRGIKINKIRLINKETNKYTGQEIACLKNTLKKLFPKAI